MDNNSVENNLMTLDAIFQKHLVETILTENGEITYVLDDGLDLAEYAQMAKKLLQAKKEIAHDFVGTVTNKSRNESHTFTYNSGWFLDGIAGGEME
ncbi:hypothetical protein ACJVDH_12625 [Pedobacter sp. AW1-32]|uniref:hypothetical protein n=1 Tax=Pedobacter sp. AW1-32 TaxID=3383026 RepID=UPI003FEE3B12